MREPAKIVALLVADGVKAEPVAMLVSALSAAGALPKLVGSRMGRVQSVDAQEFNIDVTLDDMPGVMFDAMALPDGEQAVTQLATDGHTLQLIKEHHRDGKAIFIGAASADLMTSAGVSLTLPSGKPDSGLILCSPTRMVDRISDFLGAINLPRKTALPAGRAFF